MEGGDAPRRARGGYRYAEDSPNARNHQEHQRGAGDHPSDVAALIVNVDYIFHQQLCDTPSAHEVKWAQWRGEEEEEDARFSVSESPPVGEAPV
jgi:hypothetical protein